MHQSISSFIEAEIMDVGKFWRFMDDSAGLCANLLSTVIISLKNCLSKRSFAKENLRDKSYTM
jgi:hypothetical protein